jgi:hypothetical protein
MKMFFKKKKPPAAKPSDISLGKGFKYKNKLYTTLEDAAKARFDDKLANLKCPASLKKYTPAVYSTYVPTLSLYETAGWTKADIFEKRTELLGILKEYEDCVRPRDQRSK